MSLRSGMDTVKASKNVKAAVGAFILPETESVGTVEGRLEFVNIHADQDMFGICSAIPPGRVTCSFRPDKTEEALEALGRRIGVLGELTCPEGDRFQRTVKVETVGLLPEDGDLPSLADLRGIAPDIAGDLSSEEFVRNLRDAG